MARLKLREGKGRGGARPNSGQKAFTDLPTRHLSAKLPEVLIDELEIEAQREEKSRSHLVYELLEKGLKDRRRKKRLAKQSKRMRPTQGKLMGKAKSKAKK